MALKDDLRNLLLSMVGPAFVGLDPYFGGQAAALAAAQASIDDLIRSGFLSDAAGGFLDLIGRGEGWPRLTGETDDAYRARLGSPPPATTPAMIKAAVDVLLNALSPGATCVVLDMHNGAVFAGDNDTAADEGLMELFADNGDPNQALLMGPRETWVCVPSLGGDEAMELAVCAVVGQMRMAGITAIVRFDDNLTPITGFAWDAP